MSRYERTFYRRHSAFETVTGNWDLLHRRGQPIRTGAAVMAGSLLQQGGRVQTWLSAGPRQPGLAAGPRSHAPCQPHLAQLLYDSNLSLGGYRVREGFLGYINESGQWVWELINGVRVSVQVHP